MRVTLEQAVERFLRDREVAGYKPNTILSNKHDLSKFLQAVDPTAKGSADPASHKVEVKSAASRDRLVAALTEVGYAPA